MIKNSRSTFPFDAVQPSRLLDRSKSLTPQEGVGPAMTVVASYGMVLCGNSDEFSHRYRGRIEKVKFGVPINEAFAHDIPATLLVLLLKVNKEGFMKKDIWRAPGNQAQVRKLSHVMQHGRLVNIANFSVYTAASVIKKFLSKLPGGIFGVDNEQTLFDSVLNNADAEKQRQIFYRIFCSLPVPSQHLLVLLFGTFRMVADSADSYNTKMTPNAIGISVAPSLFHSCIHDGRQAKLEDVQRFKLASQVVQFVITSFGHSNLFPRECYEFYARITGRTLRVDENWQFSFQYPSKYFSKNPDVVVFGEEGACSSSQGPSSSSALPPAVARLSNRLSSSVGEVLHETSDVEDHLELEVLRPLTACGGDAGRSLSCLDWVHENQARRMKSRSDWFLSPFIQQKKTTVSKSTDFGATKAWTASENQPLLVNEELPENEEPLPTPRKSSAEKKEQRPPLVDRKNSLKEKRQNNVRQLSGCSSVNIAGYSVPTANSSPSTTTNSAITRRRSWRMRCSQVDAQGTLKTHSLDAPYPPSSEFDDDAAVKIGEWKAGAASTEDVPPKRRSLKKKHTAMF